MGHSSRNTAIIEFIKPSKNISFISRPRMKSLGTPGPAMMKLMGAKNHIGDSSTLSMTGAGQGSLILRQLRSKLRQTIRAKQVQIHTGDIGDVEIIETEGN